jgi:hypothetical protein
MSLITADFQYKTQPCQYTAGFTCSRFLLLCYLQTHDVLNRSGELYGKLHNVTGEIKNMYALSPNVLHKLTAGIHLSSFKYEHLLKNF